MVCLRSLRVGLAVGVRSLECRQVRAALFDGSNRRRQVVELHVEATRVVELWDQADIGKRGRVAHGELSGQRAMHRVVGDQAVANIRRAPLARVDLEVGLQAQQQVEVLQRLDPRVDDLGELSGLGSKKRVSGSSDGSG